MRAFVAEVGYPLILKPRDAAGASGTYRADDADELGGAIRATGVDRGAPIAVEEFIEGHEGFYDTITIDGAGRARLRLALLPERARGDAHRWISPQFIATNRIDAPGVYDEVKALGQQVIEALGIGTSATHMEWFFGPKGLKFSEIGCRPPGVRAWDLYAVGNDIDIYREWAMAVVHGRPSQELSRRFAAGIIALRPTATATSPATRARTRSSSSSASGSSTTTSRPRARRRSRSRPATWRTPGCA